MEALAYALFEDRGTADDAIAELESGGIPPGVCSVAEHVGEIETQDIQGLGTRNRTYVILGGGFAGLVVGISAAIIFRDRFYVDLWGLLVIGGLGAALLGGLVAGLAGSAIPRPEIERFARQVRAGKVLVTLDAKSKREAKSLLGRLAQRGALETGVLSRTAIRSTLRAEAKQLQS